MAHAFSVVATRVLNSGAEGSCAWVRGLQLTGTVCDGVNLRAAVRVHHA